MSAFDTTIKRLDPWAREVYRFFTSSENIQKGIDFPQPVEPHPSYYECIDESITHFSNGFQSILARERTRPVKELSNGIILTYRYNDEPYYPTITVISSFRDLIEEKVLISRSDGWINHYHVNIVGAIIYDIYPLRDGRAWMQKTTFHPLTGEEIKEYKLLSHNDTATLSRQITRWKRLIRTQPNKLRRKGRSMGRSGLCLFFEAL